MKAIFKTNFIFLMTLYLFTVNAHANSLYNKRIEAYKKKYQERIKKKQQPQSKNVQTGSSFASDIDLAAMELEKYLNKGKPAPAQKKEIKKETPTVSSDERIEKHNLNFEQLLYFYYKKSKGHNLKDLRKEFIDAKRNNQIAILDGRYDNSFQRDYGYKKIKFKKEVKKLFRYRLSSEEFRKRTQTKVLKYFPFMPK